MATYEFECCGTKQEIIESIRAAVRAPKCSVCNGDMARVYSPFGIAFKGKGFYATDKKS